MRNKHKSGLFVKVFTRLLALIIVMGAMCLMLSDKPDVQAEENAGTLITIDDSSVDYKIKSYSDISFYRTADDDGNFEAPILTTAELEAANDTTKGEWLFAGWYTDEACTESLSSSVVYDGMNTINAGPYYAKFVSADVLSVKCQITGGTTSASDNTVLRCISTVDSLMYKSVGMHLVRPDGTTGTMDNKTKVSKKIYARTDVNMDSYSYSPKVIDTESEYFFSATETVLKDDFGKEYLVKPYWVTKDGTRVWGVSRCVTVNEALNKEVIYIPVKMDSAPDANSTLSVAYGSVTDGELKYTGQYDSDTGYAHFALEVTASSLASATKFTIGNGSSTYIYRNLGTTYTASGAQDETWYRVYYKDDSTEDEYVIATNADFYGFASLVNGGTYFSDCTVYLVCDIDANNGNLNVSGTSANKIASNTDLLTWTRIGAVASTTCFLGTFDGQMHTISGVYLSATTADHGLFGALADGTTVRNFKLKNSYIKAQQRAGSVAARSFGGCISRVYSEAVVYTTHSTSGNLGGIIGRKDNNDYNLSIENCWFAGTLKAGASATNVGGLIGYVYQGNATLSNCLNTGTVATTTVGECGGLIGEVASAKNATLTNCLSVGSIATTGVNSGAIVGNNLGTTTATNVYAVVNDDDTTTVAVGVNANGETTGTTEGTLNVLKESVVVGSKAITASTSTLFSYLKDLSATAYWAITEKSPVLSSFAEEAKDAEGNAITAIAIDMSWYNSEKSSYTLYDVADFYGFAYLSVIESVSGFTGKTIRLANDMIVNDAEIWTASETAPTFTWPGIGTINTKKFNGTFDGQGHDISGIYYSAHGYAGLFRLAGDDATIKNFSLVNSYIYGDGTHVGSIVGDSGANLQSIYSNAIVKSTKQNTGGLVGRVTSGFESHITNCWFDGTVQNTGNAENLRGTGGLVGRAQGSLFITHCLNSAPVVASDYAYETGTKVIEPYVGGLVGYSDNKVEMDCCLNIGNVTVNEGASGSYGAILGDGTGYIAIKNVYALKGTSAEIHRVKDAEEDGVMVPGVEVLEDSNFKSETELTGDAALESVSALFAEDNAGAWSVTATTPVLTTFVERAAGSTKTTNY